MSRILVADDNSNIQRMVALALKDAGIDVVAVGNGEAAVRKLPEAKPDLVLADIFMPVRSGYEVCEFIKNDPRYSHLPVVLLVGAFDPLDEREAQRVGADGILKKPFVPPDPLINMVKDLLAKSASERLVAVAVPAAVAASSVETAPAAVFPPKRAPSLPRPPDFSAAFSGPPTQEFPAPVGRVDFGKHQSPVAFSDLLAAAPAVDDADLTVTASRDPVLGEPAWDHIAPAGETPEDDGAQNHSWGAHVQPLPFDMAGPALPTAERAGENKIEPPAFGETSALPAIEFGGSERSHASDTSFSDLEMGFPEEAAAAEKAVASEAASAVPHLEIVRPTENSDASAAPASTVHEIELPELVGLDDRPWDAKPVAHEEASHHDPDSTVEELPSWLAKVSPVFPHVSPSVEASAEPPVESPLEPTAAPLDASEIESLADIHASLPSVPEHDEHAEHAADTGHSEHADHVENSAVEYSAVEQVEVEPGTTDEDETEHGESEPEAIQHDLIQPDAGEPEAAVREVEHAEQEWPVAAPAVAASSPAEIEHDSAPAAESEPEPAWHRAAEAEAASLAAKATSQIASHPAEETHVMPNGQTPDPEMIEAIVTRIVKRMQPKVFDVVTREILRPLVEALVNREIGKSEIVKH